MRAPAFWAREPGLAAGLLAPAALVYGVVAAHRMRQPGLRASIPVICIGNVTTGGAGKTPTALAIAAMLGEMGRHPAFLTRGHGGRIAGPVRVDPIAHPFPAVGDEALLLARQGPTIVSRDRPAGAALAAAGGADAIVMDDGLQNPSLAKDFRIAVFDAGFGLGNARVLPAGPLRAPMAAQWPLVDAIVLIGDGRPGEAVAAEAARRDIPIFHAALVPDETVAAALAGRRVLAFAGIGRPEKFFETLRACGAKIAHGRAYPDHHAFRPAELAALLDIADREGLVPVTTEKDQVRFAALPEGGGSRIVALPVTLRFADPAAFRAILHERLARSG